MALDLNKLENVHQSGSKTLARCPACKKDGLDESGNHLFIRQDGKFGCVVNPGAQGTAHRKRIFALVGIPSVPSRPLYKIEVREKTESAATDSTNYGPLTFLKPEEPTTAAELSELPPPPKEEHFPERRSLSRRHECEPWREKSVPEFLFKRPVRSMQYSDSNFEDAPDGSLIVEVFVCENKVRTHLLYIDPVRHCCWDCVEKEYVRPPRFYLLVSEKLGFDPISGNIVVELAALPFEPGL